MKYVTVWIMAESEKEVEDVSLKLCLLLKTSDLTLFPCLIYLLVSLVNCSNVFSGLHPSKWRWLISLFSVFSLFIELDDCLDIFRIFLDFQFSMIGQKLKLSLSIGYGQRFLASYCKREVFSLCPQSVTPASYTPGLPKEPNRQYLYLKWDSWAAVPYMDVALNQIIKAPVKLALMYPYSV